MPDETDADADKADARQDDAADGKAVPDGVPAAWLAMLMPPPVTTPAAVPPAPVQAAAVGASASLPPALPAMAEGRAPLGDAAQPVAGQPVPGGLPTADGKTPLPALLAADPTLATVHGAVVIEPGAHRGARVASVPDLAAMPINVPVPVLGKAGPAGEMFAAAIHAAGRDAPAARQDPTDPAAPQPLAMVGEATAHAVVATGGAEGGGTLDMGQPSPHAMADRIERMRDEANAADTRIRLAPDALGPVDVSVRQDGDTLHVRFRSDDATTRALLADAQPRLADMAGERGLRLGDAQVGSGGGGAADDRRAPARRAPAVAARPATMATERGAGPDSDIRIA